MQEVVAAILIFALAGLGLGIGILCGTRGLRGGCHNRREPGQADGCGRPDCCSAKPIHKDKPLVTIAQHQESSARSGST